MNYLQSINPYTNELLKQYPEESQNTVDLKLKDAQQAFEAWKQVSLPQRAELFQKLATQLRTNALEYASLITKEMGKPIQQSLAEINKSAWVCDYYAENAVSFLAEEIIPTEHKKSLVVFEPLGVILGVMPWNFPFWQVLRFAVPTIIAGNTVVLKHASNVPQCSLALQELFRKVSFPDAVFQSILVASDNMENIIAHPIVKGISLTGSEIAGSNVASIAGKYLKKCVLELGGDDPFIVLEDADLEKAAKFAVKSRMNNTGQTCIAAKRIIVQKNIHAEFLDHVIQELNLLKLGNPESIDSDLGVIARQDLANELQNDYLLITSQQKAIYPGGLKDEESTHFSPAIVHGIDTQHELYHKEIFGPILSIYQVETTEQAIELANHSHFGLGASIWTKDTNKAEKLARLIEAGCIAINTMVSSHPYLPFGGIKKSGYGRELSHYGIKEFVNIKSIMIND